MDKTADIIALNAAKLMDERGWKQPMLAKKSGLSQKFVSDMLARRKAPKVDSVDLVSQALGVSTARLCSPFMGDLEIEKIHKRVDSLSPQNIQKLSILIDMLSEEAPADQQLAKGK